MEGQKTKIDPKQALISKSKDYDAKEQEAKDVKLDRIVARLKKKLACERRFEGGPEPSDSEEDDEPLLCVCQASPCLC